MHWKQPALAPASATGSGKRQSGSEALRHPARAANAGADSGLRWRMARRLSVLRVLPLMPPAGRLKQAPP